jgi:hypothetical protein
MLWLRIWTFSFVTLCLKNKRRIPNDGLGFRSRTWHQKVEWSHEYATVRIDDRSTWAVDLLALSFCQGRQCTFHVGEHLKLGLPRDPEIKRDTFLYRYKRRMVL